MTDNKPGNETGNEVPDPKKFFDETQYNTIKIGGETEAVKSTDPTEVLLELLGSKIPGEKDAALLTLKKENAAGILIEAIKNTKNTRNKALLLAAAWESGIDLRGHLDFFAGLAHDEDLFISMEAITVLSENVADVTNEEAKRLIDKLIPTTEEHFNAALIFDVIERLKQML